MQPPKLERLTDAVATVTGRRYCSSHRGESASDSGQYIIRGKKRRWICFVCLNGIQSAEANADQNKMPQSVTVSAGGARGF
jgi:hypothetical protein